MIGNNKNVFLSRLLFLALFATSGIASAKEPTMRSVEHQDHQLQVPANWESFDSETGEGGLIQIFYDPDLQASARQCMLESSPPNATSAAVNSGNANSPWLQKRWLEVLPHIADASNVVMKDSSLSKNMKGQTQHVGEFTFYASQFFWHSKSYVMNSDNRLINLTCSASSHRSPAEAEKAFEQIEPMVKRIANSVAQTK